MTDQLDLGFAMATEWESSYRKWVVANARVYTLALKIGREAAARGKRLSSGTIVELIRWNAPREWEKDDQGFKINQNFGAYIIRDLIRDIPALKSLVELRELRSRRATGAAA